MRHSGWRAAALALLLAAAMLLSGCVPLVLLGALLKGESTSPALASAPAQWEAASFERAVRFSDIEYHQPDAREAAEAIDAFALAMRGAANYQSASMLVDMCESVYLQYDSAHTYASLKNEIDPYDRAWEREYERTYEGFEQVAAAKQGFILALIEAGFQEETRSDRPKYFSGWDLLPATAAQEALYEREAELAEELLDLLDTATIWVDGAEMTHPQILEIEGYGAYVAAEDAWLRAHNRSFVQRYIELVNVRNAIASQKGFSGYDEMIFTQEGRDYTPAMARRLIGMLRERIYPQFDGIWAMGGHYEPEIDIGMDEFFPIARDVFQGFDEEMAKALDAMLEGGFYHADTEGEGYFSSYVTFLDAWDMPFLMTVYQDAQSGMANFVHEFGHFYEMFVRGGEYAFAHDISELHSQSLELLFAGHYAEVDGQWAGELAYDAVLGSVESLSSTAYLTALELEIYAMGEEDLSVGALNDIAYETAVALGNAGYGEDYNRYGWILDDYLITSPFRELCYTTSQIVALELWELSTRDEAAALAAYDRLIHTPHQGFLDTLAYAGLSSPFDPSRIDDLAEMVRVQLAEGALEVQWDDREHGAQSG